jgi:hypothetical protein
LADATSAFATLVVDHEEQGAGLHLVALGELHLLDVALDLREDVHLLHGLHVPHELLGRVELLGRHLVHGHERRARRHAARSRRGGAPERMREPAQRDARAPRAQIDDQGRRL